jgi:hypothetical protein
MTGKALAVALPGAVTAGMAGGIEELRDVHVSGRIVQCALLLAAVAATRHRRRE